MATKKFARHPWQQWLRRLRRTKRLTLVQGEHYYGQPHTMAQQVRRAASYWGLRVAIGIDNGTLRVTVKQGS